MKRSKTKKEITSVFHSPDEYFQFCVDHGVYGADAVKLKKTIDKSLFPVLRKKND